MRFAVSLGLTLAVALALAPPAFADGDVAGMREELAAQKRALAELEARVREHEEEAAKKNEEPSPTHVEGFAQVDWTAFRQSSEDEVTPAGEPLNENRFTLRRARVRLAHDAGLVQGELTIDANTRRGLQVRPYNVEGSVKWPERTAVPGAVASPVEVDHGPFIMVTTGLMRTPFGFDVQESTRERPWLERATMSSALFPSSNDLGVRVMGGVPHVTWALGVMNGDPIGEETFPGRDPNKSKDLVLRLVTATKVTGRVRVSAGVSGLTGRGFHEGDPATKDQLIWRDQNEDGVVQVPELQVTPGSPATPSEGFGRFALGADARVTIDLPVVGELQLRGEIVRAKNLDRGRVVADPVAAGRDLRELGWYVGATQELTKWAIVGVRYDLYDPDSDAQDQRPFAVVPVDASFRTWSFMAAARLPKRARLIAEYDHRANALGRDVAGMPTTLADDSFTLRAEVRF